MVKLLIVDDVEDYLRSLRNALRGMFEVVTAQSIEEAKEKTDESIALALVDIRLSEEDTSNRDGLIFLEWIKLNFADVPVIIMSAYREFDMAVDALNLGAAYFLRKPINLRELKALLKTYAEERSLAPQTAQWQEQLSGERQDR